jgi:putative oxidoreductase
MRSSVAAAGPDAGVRTRLAAITAWLGRFPLAIHQLLFRMAIAGVFLKAGLNKVASWETTSIEIGCSLLLLFGLASRLAMLSLLGMILTIQLFVYPDAWPEHLVWGSILLFLLTRGAGAISLDRPLGVEPGAGR